MTFSPGDHYTTRDGFHVEIIKATPNFKYKAVGVFRIRQIRFHVFFDAEGNEFFGEKGLDLFRKLPNCPTDPLISRVL